MAELALEHPQKVLTNMKKFNNAYLSAYSRAELSATYSIVARDPETLELGVAVQTHQLAVGRIVPWIAPGIGAVATQALVNVRFGPMALAMLRTGVSAEVVVRALITSDPDASRRQLAIVDAHGNAAAYTGDLCIKEAGHFVGKGYSIQSNMMLHDTVLDAMRMAFESTQGDLADRMLATLRAAEKQEGDIRGGQSAALKIVPGTASTPDWDARFDLRIDEHPAPIEELSRLVRLRRAQILDSEGHDLLRQGKTDVALTRWKDARNLAPELEEIGFWQAVALADANPDTMSVSLAARILDAALGEDPNLDNWLELIRRLVDSGMIRRDGAAQELLDAFEDTR